LKKTGRPPQGRKMKIAVCEAIRDMLAYHAAVAKEPVWMTFNQIYDIMAASWSYSFPKRNIGRCFPSVTQWGQWASQQHDLKVEKRNFTEKAIVNLKVQTFKTEKRAYAFTGKTYRVKTVGGSQ
jgi:hypothetical protein